MFNYSVNKAAQFLFLLIMFCSSPARAGWQLEWIDTFDSSRVDRSKWTSQVQANYNAEVQCYTDDDTSVNKNYDVSNGTLKIIARKQANNCAGLGGAAKSWTSGRLNSKDKREFLYGRIEARIRFHDLQRGSWPAFWMIENRIAEHPIANDNDFVSWPNPGAGEIDVWEWFSNSPGTYITNFFNTGGCGSEVRYPYPGGAADVQQWHDYAIEWDSSSIEFFVDDLRVASHDISNCAQYKEPMFVLLNVAMGGTLGGTIDPSLTTATMEIDYVAHCSINSSNNLTRCNDSTPQSTTPVITSNPITYVQSNDLYTYSLLASDADGDNLIFSAPTLPNWLGFNQVTGLLSGTPSSLDVGNHNVTLTVNDGTSLISQQFIIFVNDNTPQSTIPVITSNPVNFVQGNDLYTYSLTASDADGDNLIFSAPTLPNWLGFNQATGLLSGTPSNLDVGNHNVTLTVNDGTSVISQQFIISVSAPPTITPSVQFNIIPKITGNPSLQAKVGANYQYLLEAIDPDSAVIHLTALLLPPWLTFNSSTGLLSGVPSSTEVGSHLVTLSASDGFDAIKQSFTVEVTDSSNTAPIFTSNPIKQISVNDTYSYSVTTFDSDGNNLNITAINLPEWLDFNAETFILTGTPREADMGNHSVNLLLEDGTDEANQIFNIEVLASEEVNTIDTSSAGGGNVDFFLLLLFSLLLKFQLNRVPYLKSLQSGGCPFKGYLESYTKVDI